MKVSHQSLRLIRIIAAVTGERHYQVLERLLAKELTRVRPKIKAMKTVKKAR